MGRRDRSDVAESEQRKEKKRESRKRSRREESDDDNKDRKKESRKRRRRREEDGGSSSEDIGNDEDGRRRKKDSKKRRRRKEEDSGSSSSSEDDERKKDSKKKRRKEDKKKKKKKKKSSKHDKKKSGKKKKEKRKRSRSSSSSSDEEEDSKLQELARNYALADAVHQLLLEHPTPAMAKDTLPLVLLKLGGGTRLDLRSMPDRGAAEGIQRVLKSLESFGVAQEEPQVWKWTVPSGEERFLLRLVRTLLNDIGLTMEAIAQKDEKEEETNKLPPKETNSESLDQIRDHTVQMLQSFQQAKDPSAASTLPGELGGLCKMLLEGESVALDGLPDANLRQALEGLFQECGLELQEMQDEDESDDEEEDNNDEKAMGYGLPESKEQLAQQKLLSVMKACETVASAPARPATKGPMPMPAGYQAHEESSDDEEGPAPVGQRTEAPVVSKEVLQLQAAMRARQLRGAVTGQEELLSSDPNVREEWMLDPGKFDFLGAIKAGNPMKSRNFANKKAAGGDDEPRRAMDPKIQAEMDAIMQAHTEARGPTLVEQHRLKKKREREEKAGQKGEWKWSRDKDLDSGRRCDKDALNQILGGATSDLKKKFQGGF